SPNRRPASPCSWFLRATGKAHRVLRAIVRGQPRLFLERGRDGAVATRRGVAVIVDVEKLGRDGVATVVALPARGIDAHLPTSRFAHGENRTPQPVPR